MPVNWHLTAPEVAYILSDSGAGAFVAHERFGDVAAEAAEAAGIEPEARFAVGPVPGFAPLTALGADGSAGALTRGRRAPRWCTPRAPRAGPRACAAR